jgi:peptidoglycan/LPS O-acetylase OafA/YrhL
MLNYKPELDGLRAISILLVIFSHAGFGSLVPGGFGVTVFFFVSGFLITSLLIDEENRKGKIDLYKFYLRRFWRLLPPFFFFLILAISLIIFVNGTIKTREVLAALFYFSNYYKAIFHFDNVGNAYSPLSILWSLAIEEHFYIIFAPLLAFTFKSRLYLKIIVAFLFIPLFIRVAIAYFEPNMAVEGGYNYCATETRIDSIAFGCFLAYIASQGFFAKIKKIIINNLFLILSIALVVFTFIYRDLFFRETFRYSVQNIAIFFIVANIVYGQSKLAVLIKSVLSTKLMIFIGKLSYSLYLQHWLALSIITIFLSESNIYTLFWQSSFWALSLSLTFFSYFVIEKPTIAFRKKYGSNVSR